MVVSVRTGGIGMTFDEVDCSDHVLAAARAADHLRGLFDHSGQWLKPDIIVAFEDADVVHLHAHGLGWLTDDHLVVFGNGVG